MHPVPKLRTLFQQLTEVTHPEDVRDLPSPRGSNAGRNFSSLALVEPSKHRLRAQFP